MHYPIDTITDMYVAYVDGEYQLFTISGSEGLGQFTLNIPSAGFTIWGSGDFMGTDTSDLIIADDTGADISGAGGADILKDGAGQDQLAGGDGADIFILTADGNTDVIVDFDPEQDRLDLSLWSFFRSAAQLTITSNTTGAILHFAMKFYMCLAHMVGLYPLQISRMPTH